MGRLYQRFREVARRQGNKTALIDGEARYSYVELLRQAERWTARLADPSRRPRVALLLDDPFHTITASLAVASLDGACIPTNTQLLPEQLLSAWQASEVDTVIYEPGLARRVEALPKDAMTCIPADACGNRPLQTDSPNGTTGGEDFLITLSSGSTGDPKPIVLSQAVKLRRARQTWDLYRLSDQDVVLCASPYHHSLGQRLTWVPLLLGATLVHLRRFTPLEWLDSVQRHRVSFVIAVASHLYALRDQLLDSVAQIRSLDTIVTSSAPIDAAFKAELFHAVGCDFHEIYGATEIAVATNLAPQHAEAKYSTVGLPCPGVEVRILDQAGDTLPTGEIGEIAVRTPLLFSGYHGRVDLTRAALHNGWFLTGDLGSLDRDGFLSYASRKKDIIIAGGINIYPKDIEKVLAQHPAIREVAVIGVPDELLGDVVVAVCVADRADGLEQELRRLANRRLAAFQRPLKYFFRDSMPLTASGKLSKLALRECYQPENRDWTQALRILVPGAGNSGA